MLTDQQIETAARKLCELRGLKPESETVFTERAPHSPTYRVSSTHLKDCIREIRAADQVREATAFAVQKAEWDKRHEPQSPPFCPPPGLCECGHSHYEHLRNHLNPDLHGCRFCDCTDYKGRTEPQIDASQSFNLCPNCQHEWRYHEIHQGHCVGSVEVVCECRNKQPRI